MVIYPHLAFYSGSAILFDASKRLCLSTKSYTFQLTKYNNSAKSVAVW